MDDEKKALTKKLDLILYSADLISSLVDEIADMLVPDCPSRSRAELKKMITGDIIEMLDVRADVRANG